MTDHAAGAIKPKDAKGKAPQPVTPMMAQYFSIKETSGDALLFYRMGDFYELFFDDAVKAAAALDIALTKRGKHAGADIPMCGVPVHSSEVYLQRLIKKGFRVAVCEQTEDPKEAKKRGSKAVVRREVVRLVTPGTLSEDNLLEARGRNIITALAKTLAGDYALAWADISDGLFCTANMPADKVSTEIAALRPRELLLSETLYQDPDFMQGLPLDGVALTPQPSTKFDARAGERRLKEQYSVESLDGFGSFSKAEISAAGALLDYLELTQAGNPVQLSPPTRRATAGFMAIDPATRASLEIDRTQKGTRQGSLLSVIDRTKTGAGARELADRLARPLLDVKAIKNRQDAVGFFIEDNTLKDNLRQLLTQAGDLARAVSRLSLGRGGPRDLIIVRDTLGIGESIHAEFTKKPNLLPPNNVSKILAQLSLSDKEKLAVLRRDLSKALLPDVPMQARDGGFIALGWQVAIDQLKTLRDDSRKIVAGLQVDYAKEADVPTLKIKHNNVLGYFIEVSPKYADIMLNKGPDSPFIHRQTLVSGVRFTTTKLADLDAKISGAADKVLALELAEFGSFAQRVRELSDDLRISAQAIAALDVQTAWAEWAIETQACRPKIDDSLCFHVQAGRHPVVRQALQKTGEADFTPNDCALDADGKTADRLTLITGPNMAGKSTYLRQNALMFILAQAGGYVPALSAHIGIADALFSRVGASDDLSKGRSTFMTEMIETAAILNQATQRSFVILDEIGRGTSTFDGLSIAWATTEHWHSANKARALFATHYHELTDLVETLEAAGNASLRAKEWNGDLVFLHDVRPGAADKSYGVQVARLAGLPRAATERAQEVLTRLEAEADTGTKDKALLGGLPLFSATPSTPPTPEPSETDLVLKTLDVDALSPRQALDLLYDLKAKLN